MESIERPLDLMEWRDRQGRLVAHVLGQRGTDDWIVIWADGRRALLTSEGVKVIGFLWPDSKVFWVAL